MSTGRTNFAQMGRGIDLNWFKFAHDITAYPTGHLTSIPVVPEQFDIPTYSTGNTLAYGQQINFELDKRGDLLGEIELVIDRGALSTSGTAGSLAFADWEGFACIDTVRFVYANKIFHEVTGDELYLHLQRRCTLSERYCYGMLQGGIFGTGWGPAATTGGTSTSSTIDLGTWAQSAKQVVVPLFVPWKELGVHIPMVVLPNKIKVEVVLKTLAKCVGTPPTSGTVSCTINNAYLRCQYLHVPRPKQQELFKQINQSNGVDLKTLTTEGHFDVAYTGSSTQLVIPLKNVKNAITHIEILTRTANNAGFGTANSCSPFTFTLDSSAYVKSFYIRDNGTAITKTYTRETSGSGVANQYNKWRTALCNPIGNPELGALQIRFAPEDKIDASYKDCFGSRLLQMYNNPELVLNFSAAPSSNTWYIDVHAFFHNYLTYEGAEVRKFIR